MSLQWRQVDLSHSARSPNFLDPAENDQFVGKCGVFGRILHEMGPGKSKSALDQDLETYIDWLRGFIR